MGLDMYLYARKYFSSFLNPEHEDAMIDILKKCDLSPEQATYYANESMTVAIKVGYWRKANAIHKWFVDHAQDGEDNCAEYYVAREQLEALKEECKQVLHYKNAPVHPGAGVFLDEEIIPPEAEWPLPPAEGFFFGTIDRDEYYYTDIKNTIRMIEDLLANPELEDWEFYYRSSW